MFLLILLIKQFIFSYIYTLEYFHKIGKIHTIHKHDYGFRKKSIVFTNSIQMNYELTIIKLKYMKKRELCVRVEQKY